MSPQATKSVKGLEDLYFNELADIYDVEKRLVKSLPKMAKAAISPALKEAIEQHLEETQGHCEKLEQVFEEAGKAARGKKCDAMVGMLEEGDEIAKEFKGSPALDAAIISAAQKVEHYEIVAYGCLQEWAGMIGNEDAAQIFGEILEEEKKCDETLTEIARTAANMEAESADDDENGNSSSRSSRGRGGSRKR